MRTNITTSVTVIVALLFLSINAFALQSIPSLAKKTQPAVVLITVYDAQGNQSGQGSGFFISQDGEVITNWHVISDASSAIIKTSAGAMFKVRGIIAKDEKRDLAKISLETRDISFYYLNLAASLPKVGEQVFVVGNPFGLESTVSDGLVSAIREIPDVGNIIQVSAPISPGSSGSPIINLNGQVVGIASFQLIKGQNLNFAISATEITKLHSSDKIQPLPLVKKPFVNINPEVQLQDNGYIRIVDQYVEELTAEQFYGEYLAEFDKGKIIKRLHVKIQFLKPCKATTKGEGDDITQENFLCVMLPLVWSDAQKKGDKEGAKELFKEMKKQCPDYREYYTPKFRCNYKFKVFLTSFSPSKFKEYESHTYSSFPEAKIINIIEDRIVRKIEMLPGEEMWITYVIPEDATSWHVWVPK